MTVSGVGCPPLPASPGRYRVPHPPHREAERRGDPGLRDRTAAPL